MKCQLCDREYRDPGNFTKHLRKFHELSKPEYENRYGKCVFEEYVNPFSKKEVQDKIKKRCLEKYGSENPMSSEIIRNKWVKNFRERYGVDNPQQRREIRDKTAITNLKKYGGTGFACQDLLDKAKETCKSRYGNENYRNSEMIKSSLKKFWDDPIKSERCRNQKRSTSLDHYGVDNPMKSEDIRSRAKETCLRRYGVESSWLLPQVAENRLYSKDSKPNKFWAELLSENEIEYDREFRIDRSFYDFRILNSNILLEVNPSFTHNSTISIHGKDPISKDYHYNKTKLAVDNGFICLNIFEWVDPDLVIALIKKSDLISEFVGIEKHELHGWLIYDSGFKISSRTDRNICI